MITLKKVLDQFAQLALLSPAIIMELYWTEPSLIPQFKREDHLNSKLELVKLLELGMKVLFNSKKEEKLLLLPHQIMLMDQEELEVSSHQMLL